MSLQVEVESLTKNQEAKASSRYVGDASSHHEEHQQQCVSSPITNRQELEGNTFDGGFKVGRLLRIENHSDVYASASSDDVGLVAHVYDITDISQKDRRYRLRNLKKCSRRAVAEVKFQGNVILICRQDPSTENGQEDLSAEKVLMHNETSRSNLPKTTGEKRHNTELQKETARIKQCKKRRDERCW